MTTDDESSGVYRNGDRGEHLPLITSLSKSDLNLEPKRHNFNFRKLWAFMGPGLLVSIGFLDPGNITSDLESGGLVQYRLLWVLLLSTIFGLVMQRLSARLGVVTQSHLAELCHEHYRTVPRVIIWLMMQIANVASDMQVVIGLAVAICLLSNRIVPPWIGVLISLLDIFIFLCFSKQSLEKLEFLFAILIAIMAVTFGYDFILSKPDGLHILEGLTIPRCNGCDSQGLLQSVGIIGSVMTPHNLYLHSALVHSREIDRSSPSDVKEANLYFFLESAIAVFVSFLINLFVTSVFGNGLYNKTNADVVHGCAQHHYLNVTSILLNDHHRIKPTLYTGGIFLGCTFGLSAMYIWGIGILASSQSATMTGIYAGQFMLNGFLGMKWSSWKVSLLIRTISILPLFYVTFTTYVDNLTHMNTILNVVMSLQLPFAVIPTVAFTSSANIMGEFTNSKFSIIFSSLLGLSIIFVNVVFVVRTVLTYTVVLRVLIPGIILLIIYLLFCFYLCIHAMFLIGVFDMFKLKQFREFGRKYIF